MAKNGADMTDPIPLFIHGCFAGPPVQNAESFPDRFTFPEPTHPQQVSTRIRVGDIQGHIGKG